MSSPQEPRTKSNRILAIFKRPQRGESSGSSTPDQHGASVDRAESAVTMSFKERARERHLKAMSLLEDVLKGRNENWGNFEIPKLEGEMDDLNPTEFKNKLEALCQAYCQKRNSEGLAQQCAHVVERCFKGFIPFAKTVLSIAKPAYQVLR